MEAQALLEELFDKKVLDVIRFFLAGKGKEFYLQEAAAATGVSLATVYRISQKLVALEVLKEVPIKHLKLYTLASNEGVAFLERILKRSSSHLEAFIKEITKDPAIQEIILHGKPQDDKANVLLIGEGVDAHQVKLTCAAFKERGFTVSALALGRDQYEQMSSMGLYSGAKKTVYTR